VLQIDFPPIARRMLDGLGFVNVLDINISSWSCVSDQPMDYVTGLLFVTVGPVLVCMIMLVMYIVDLAWVRSSKKYQTISVSYSGSGNDGEDQEDREYEQDRQSRHNTQPHTLNEDGLTQIDTITNRYAVIFFLITYTLLTSVSSTIAAAYACTNIDPDDVLPEGVDKFYLT